MTDVRLEINEEAGYAVATLDRPEKRNAIRIETVENLHEALGRCENHPRIRGLVITGAGDKAFSAGGDLRDELRFSRSEPENADRLNRLGAELMLRIIRAPFPVVAAVNGVCMGAAVCLVVACDLALAAESAIFAAPTSGLGGMPGWGSQIMLPWAVGRQQAQRMLLANERLDSREALRIGLVTKVEPDDRLLPEAERLAAKMASLPPRTIGTMKKLVSDWSLRLLAEGLEEEAGVYVGVNTDPNFSEGIEAFLEKRPPRFKL